MIVPSRAAGLGTSVRNPNLEIIGKKFRNTNILYLIMSSYGDMTVLSHPLVLLLIGAFISSLLIPYFTRQWQDNQKEFELKTALADEVNEAVSDATISGRLNIDATREERSDVMTKWQVSKDIISSKIEAYFSDLDITGRWINLSNIGTYYLYMLDPMPGKIIDTLTNYNHQMCQRLSHVMLLYSSYPSEEKSSNPLNLDRSDLATYRCNED